MSIITLSRYRRRQRTHPCDKRQDQRRTPGFNDQTAAQRMDSASLQVGFGERQVSDEADEAATVEAFDPAQVPNLNRRSAMSGLWPPDDPPL